MTPTPWSGALRRLDRLGSADKRPNEGLNIANVTDCDAVVIGCDPVPRIVAHDGGALLLAELGPAG
jgi:hypothetical protein